jgi:predicted PurR-regulated permease PerM
MAILKFSGWAPIIGVVVVIIITSLLEQMLITPRIIGNNVGLPPLAVLLAVLAGGELFGFVGTLLAVPAAAVIKVLLLHARQSYLTSEGYTAPALTGVASEPAAASVSRPRRPRRRRPPPATAR